MARQVSAKKTGLQRFLAYADWLDGLYKHYREIFSRIPVLSIEEPVHLYHEHSHSDEITEYLSGFFKRLGYRVRLETGDNHGRKKLIAAINEVKINYRHHTGDSFVIFQKIDSKLFSKHLVIPLNRRLVEEEEKAIINDFLSDKKKKPG